MINDTYFAYLQHKDLLQLMIDASVEGENFKLTDNGIVAHSVGFLLAGYETTANTLSYTSYLLALHPETQRKLQLEIEEYFSRKGVCCMVLFVLTICNACLQQILFSKHSHTKVLEYRFHLKN